MLRTNRRPLTANRFSHGFTLLEMSIVLIIASVVTIGVMVVFTQSLTIRQLEETETKQATIQDALFNYRLAYNRLPCPADITALTSSANFGLSAAGNGDCASGSPAANFVDSTGTAHDPRGGMVPTRTLRLPDDYAFDSWGRRFLYVVAKDMTQDEAFNISIGNDPTVRITVQNGIGQNNTQQAVYALISHGPNGHGGYTRNASRINADSTNAAEQQNCHCGATAASTSFNGTFVQKSPTRDPADYTNSFDDIVAYATRADMVLHSAKYWTVIGGGNVINCSNEALVCLDTGGVETCLCNQ